MKEVYNEGDLIICTEGSYSDYIIIDAYKCLITFEVEEQVVLYLADNIDGYSSARFRGGSAFVRFDSDLFLAHLVSLGILAKTEHKELHLLDYGEYEILLEDYNRLIRELK